MRSSGDLFETVWTMINRIKTSDDREQNLRSADIAGGLLTADVLLTCLQCHAKGKLPLSILRNAD